MSGGRAGFASLVAACGEAVTLVCCLYENRLPQCARLHLSLDALAPQFPHVRFVRLRASDAFAGFADVGLPALLLYRNGRCIANALSVAAALPAAFSDADVARLLQSKGALELPDGRHWLQSQEQQTRHGHTVRSSAASRQQAEDEDEDEDEA